MGRYRRLKQKLNKDWVDIDYSEYRVDGYSYLYSSYSHGISSALITQENKDLICSFIPVYNKRKRIISRFLRLVIDRRLQDKLIEDSLLYKLYCNGFTEAFRLIDQKIKKNTDMMIYPSIAECKATICSYISELDDLTKKPSEYTKTLTFWEYLLELGKHEGAMVRGLLYEQQMSSGIQTNKTEPQLRGFLRNVQDESKDELLKKIKDHFSVQRRGRNVAIFVKAMWINRYLLESEIKEEIYNAIETEVAYSFGKDRSSINKYLAANNIYKIEADATLLAEELKIK